MMPFAFMAVRKFLTSLRNTDSRPRWAKKAHYCGYVCREDSEAMLSEKKLQSYFGKTNGKFVLVTGGGGADAAFMMEQFIGAVRLLYPDLHFDALLTTGPFMPKGQCERLRRQARGLPIVVTRLGQDSIRHLRRADLVISMAGYNTISEILRFRKNAIVVPRPGPSAEQTMRTRLMSERSFFSTIHPTHLTAENLSEMIWQKLHNGNGINEARLPSLTGASTAANLMLKA
jgi:predicted glycosyltransferase